MLVISRKGGQGVVIETKEGAIRIILVEIEKGRVRLGLEAPKGCTIIREELLSEITAANRLSAIESLEGIKGIIDGESN